MRRAVLVAGGATTAVLLAGGLLTSGGFGPWYDRLRKPAWQPPDWAFGPAWTTIGALTTAAAVLAWDAAPRPRQRTRIVGLFAANGVLNMLWSGLFFTLRRGLICELWSFFDTIDMVEQLTGRDLVGPLLHDAGPALRPPQRETSGGALS